MMFYIMNNNKLFSGLIPYPKLSNILPWKICYGWICEPKDLQSLIYINKV